jgi:hypothetical protein
MYSRAWVGNLKQRVPITSKSSKFKGVTKHYVVKLPKSAGARHYCQKILRVPQCVEMKLRWRFYVHTSTCPEIYFWSWYWIIFDISNTRTWLGFAQKHVWNTIEDLSSKKVNKIQFKTTISSIMFQICFWVNPSQDLVFEISKII